MHGTRAYYQKRGCRCTTCRAANAHYEATYRTRKRRGLPIFGATVPAHETWRQLRLLTTEYETESALAKRLGLTSDRLRFNRQRIRVRTMLTVRRLYSLDILAGLDQPSTALQNERSA